MPPKDPQHKRQGGGLPPSRPWVVINMAMSADGKIASANRRVTRIGSDGDLDLLYALRATGDAILCGARTLEETGATLGNGGDRHTRSRLRRGLREFPLRIIATAGGSISPNAEVWKHRFSPILVLTTRQAPGSRLQKLNTLANHVWIGRGSTVNLPSTLRRLHREFQVRRLIVEGGGALNASLFEADLVDELHVTLCPLLIGGRTAPTVADGPGMSLLAQANRFSLASWKRRGTEVFAVFLRRPRIPRQSRTVA